MENLWHHYTNATGFKAISALPTWVFKASKPPGEHPRGAYFTTLPPGTRNLAKRLFIRGSVDKVGFMFCFAEGSGLRPLDGGRGAFIFYSAIDYNVGSSRQRHHGPTAEYPGRPE